MSFVVQQREKGSLLERIGVGWEQGGGGRRRGFECGLQRIFERVIKQQIQSIALLTVAGVNRG